MDAITLTLKIDNQDALLISKSVDPVRIISGYPTLTWSFDTITSVKIDEYTGMIEENLSIDQLSYDIRISNSFYNIGTDLFIGNRASTGITYSKDKFWNYAGTPLKRDTIYYGQINIKDELNRNSGWITFLFKYNTLPYVINVKIIPINPFVADNLVLSYTFNDNDGDIEQGTIIRWFKNGIYQKQFDDETLVKSKFLQVDDIWVADVLPSDGYEYGARTTSPLVRINQTTLTLSDVEVSPENPNENDILRAKCTYSSLADDKPDIRWFINGLLNNNYNDQEFVRPNAVPGDIIKFEIKPKNGTSYYSSPEVTIGYSNFVVYNIMIDGKEEPLEVSTISPTISWKVYKPYNKDINYISIKIGTFYEVDNIYSTILQTDREIFTIPLNLLNDGIDYYISIAVSDIMVFNNYTSSHFRIKGSRWEESIDNSVGWTIETTFIMGDLEAGTTGIFSESSYQTIRFNDGSRFGEVRIHDQKISFASETFTFSEKLDTTGVNILTIVGKNDDVKIYLNRELVIDGTNLLKQVSTIKRLEIGNPTGTSFIINYKYFYYTVLGAFYPGISKEYSNIKFHTFMELKNNEIIGFKSYVKNYRDYKIFGANPDDTEESGSIYALVSGKTQLNNTVSRTFAPINKIRRSPNGEKIVFAHAKGVSIVTGYVISAFDYEIDFDNLERDANDYYIYTFPDRYGWELVQDIGYDAAYFNNDGFNINTISNIRV